MKGGTRTLEGVIRPPRPTNIAIERAGTSSPAPPGWSSGDSGGIVSVGAGPGTESAPEPSETESPGDEPGPPEDQPGGAGDEEPARALALFTGEDGRISPPAVRVPAFISIRVELRSADGGEYGLRFGGETIRVAGGLGSVSTTIDGLRPGQSLAGRPTGAGNVVRLEATAVPGP